MTGGPTFGVGRIRWGWFIVGCARRCCCCRR